MPTRQGSIRLFRFHGIDLYLHWSWFVVALFEIRGGMGGYASVRWNALDYLALFLVVAVRYDAGLALLQKGPPDKMRRPSNTLLGRRSLGEEP